MDKDLLNKLLVVLNEALNVSEPLNVDSDTDNTIGWDSLAYFSILTAVEESFEITIPNEMLNSFDSVKGIMESVEKLLVEKK